MDLRHSKTVDSNVSSEVFNLQNSKSSDLIQPSNVGGGGGPTDNGTLEALHKGEWQIKNSPARFNPTVEAHTVRRNKRRSLCAIANTISERTIGCILNYLVHAK